MVQPSLNRDEPHSALAQSLPSMQLAGRQRVAGLAPPIAPRQMHTDPASQSLSVVQVGCGFLL